MTGARTTPLPEREETRHLWSCIVSERNPSASYTKIPRALEVAEPHTPAVGAEMLALGSLPEIGVLIVGSSAPTRMSLCFRFRAVPLFFTE